MEKNVTAGAERPAEKPTSTCIDWFSEGETRVVEINGIRVVVRFVGRKGRRGRIVIEAPAGAVFLAGDRIDEPFAIERRCRNAQVDVTNAPS